MRKPIPELTQSELLTADPVFDVQRVREDFPILSSFVKQKPLVYLDNAATTQKPVHVIDAIRKYYSSQNSNVHRGVHYLSQLATEQYEAARETIREFLNAESTREIIFTRGTTEGINLLARSFGRNHLKPGDEVLISTIEHHSNIVPWQMICDEKGAILKVIPINDAGELLMDEFEKLLSERTKLVSVTHISNALGTVNPIRDIIRKAHTKNIPVLIDAAQSIQHVPIDVRELDCEFLVFSGHKLYGPTGIGALYGKAEWMEILPPYQGGGDMILSVAFEKTTYNDLPYKFEAGTPNIAGAIGLAAAIDYFTALDMDALIAHEANLLTYATRRISTIPGLTLIGTAKQKASILSFTLCAVHPHDIGTILDQYGVAIRAGHHCAQPTMQRLGIPATARASFSFYNTKQDVDVLVNAVEHVLEVFG